MSTKRHGVTLWAATLTLCCTAAAVEQAPARGLEAITVPEGFTVELAAHSDLSQYPMFMTFDHEGRLFVAESSGSHLPGKELALDPQFFVYRHRY